MPHAMDATVLEAYRAVRGTPSPVFKDTALALQEGQ
jgi:hypothetical protein